MDSACYAAIWDDQLGCWISEAEVAETRYTAFTSKKDKELHVTARLIVRRGHGKAQPPDKPQNRQRQGNTPSNPRSADPAKTNSVGGLGLCACFIIPCVPRG
jgi:hypothetical protein